MTIREFATRIAEINAQIAHYPPDRENEEPSPLADDELVANIENALPKTYQRKMNELAFNPFEEEHPFNYTIQFVEERIEATEDKEQLKAD